MVIVNNNYVEHRCEEAILRK